MKSRPILLFAPAVGLIAVAVVIYSMRGAVGPEPEPMGLKYNAPRKGRVGPARTDGHGCRREALAACRAYARRAVGMSTFANLM